MAKPKPSEADTLASRPLWTHVDVAIGLSVNSIRRAIDQPTELPTMRPKEMPSSTMA